MHKYIASFLLLLALFASSGVSAQPVLVFTDSQHPVFSVPEHAHVFELDQAQQLENSLSVGLNADERYSAELAKSRLNNQIHRQLAQAYQSVVDAWTLGIQKIPAIVVNRKYVVYGETNVARAILRIQAYQEAHP